MPTTTVDKITALLEQENPDAPFFVYHEAIKQIRDEVANMNPNGGSQPVQAVYGGNAVNIGNGGQDFLTFDTLADGAALLDISTPNAPTFVAAGTYAVTATYFSDALTAGGFAVASVGTSGPHGTDATDSSDHPEWSAVVPLTVVVDTAGITLQVTITNNDGAAARNFTLLNLTLVKLA